jgi:peptide/nickel transport system substrate-binding protein
MPDQGPNWLGPFNPGDKMITANSSLKQLLWVPLIQSGGAGGTMGWDKPASVASAYTFSADGLTIDITLGNFTWSDGKPVTTRDVEFQYNLIKNNIADTVGGVDSWSSYSKGKFPDNVKELKIVDDKHLSITWDKVYNPDWLVLNQLIYMIPLPQHVMDKTSASEAVGDYDRTADGAKKVYAFLMEQGKDVTTYTSNPLWAVVDGPYKVQSWTSDNAVTIVANDAYTGDDKPTIKTVNLKPYTSDDAEMNDVRSGAVDYGYITATQMSAQQQFTAAGYTITPWMGWGATYAPYNYASDANGKVFSQLYVRQALQSAIDQPAMVQSIFYGTANEDYGPVPQGIESDFLSDTQKNNPYPYDLTKAAGLLTSHGWTKGSDGYVTCTNPGTGADQCGEGIAQGQGISLNAVIETNSVTGDEWAYIKSQWQQIGVALTLSPSTQVTTTAQDCDPTKNAGACTTWDLVFFGTAGSWYFPAYPTGERLFHSGVMKWNCGQWVDTKADSLIDATLTGTDTKAMQDYSAYLAEQLPVLWLPMPSYQISVTATGLNVGTQDPGGSFTPQRWVWEG